MRIVLIVFVTVLLLLASCGTKDSDRISSSVPQGTPTPGVLLPDSTSISPLTSSSESITPVCTDADCFLSLARDCFDVDVRLHTHGATFFYDSKGCVLTKTLVSLDDPNPEIKAILEGKSMTCAYQKGLIDPRWVKTLAFGLEGCEGELKEKLTWLLMVE